MVEIKLPYGHSTLCVNILDAVLGEVVSPRTVEAAADPEASIRADAARLGGCVHA